MNFPKIVIALDHSQLDSKLIEFSHFITDNFKTTSAQFFHVVPHFLATNILGSQLNRFFNQKSEVAKELPQELKKNINAVFTEKDGLDVKLLVTEGKPQEQLLRMIREQKPDLLILGKKEKSDGSGIIAQRIARKADCAVCFVTENANTKLEKILVPVDFSIYSLKALKAALHLKAQLEGVAITALHLIDVPMTAYKINRNKDAIIHQLKSNADGAFRHFLTRNRISERDINFKMLLNDHFNVAEYVQQTAAAEQSDLIITGAKGHSGLSGFVFGSVTEKLIAASERPVMVIR